MKTHNMNTNTQTIGDRQGLTMGSQEARRGIFGGPGSLGAILGPREEPGPKSGIEGLLTSPIPPSGILLCFFFS